MRKFSDLRQIQLVGVQKILDCPAVMLGLQMGFGKTAITLTAAKTLLDCMEVGHVLVIAPLLVAEETWPEEIESWEHTADLEYEVLTGSAERRVHLRLVDVMQRPVDNAVVERAARLRHVTGCGERDVDLLPLKVAQQRRGG